MKKCVFDVTSCKSVAQQVCENIPKLKFEGLTQKANSDLSTAIEAKEAAAEIVHLFVLSSIIGFFSM